MKNDNMKNTLPLLSIFWVSFSFGQIIIADELTSTSDKLDPQIEINIHTQNKDKGMIFPIVESDASITDKKDGMVAYHSGKGCFVYYKEGTVSQCIIDLKSDAVLTSTYSTITTPLSSTTWRDATLSTANNAVTFPNKTMVKVIVNSAHQYNQSGGLEQCASAQLGLFVNGSLVKIVSHRTDATTQGNIFPVSMTYSEILPAGTYTFDLKERINPAHSTCVTNSMNWFMDSQMDITYKEVD